MALSYCPGCLDKQRQIDDLKDELVRGKGLVRRQERTAVIAVLIVRESGRFEKSVFFAWVFFPVEHETVFFGRFRAFFDCRDCRQHCQTGQINDFSNRLIQDISRRR